MASRGMKPMTPWASALETATPGESMPQPAAVAADGAQGAQGAYSSDGPPSSSGGGGSVADQSPSSAAVMSAAAAAATAAAAAAAADAAGCAKERSPRGISHIETVTTDDDDEQHEPADPYSAPPAIMAPACEGCDKKEGPGVTLQTCGRCRSVRYCSSDCQQADWTHHKAACLLINASKKQNL